MIARGSIPLDTPSGTLKNGLGGSLRPADRRSRRWIELTDTSRRRYFYAGLSIASGYRYTTTIEKQAPGSHDSGFSIWPSRWAIWTEPIYLCRWRDFIHASPCAA
jgi:hypothetical protein